MDAELRAAERAGDGQRLKVALQRAGRWPEPLPAEVVEATQGFFAELLMTMVKFRRPDPEKIRYFEKEHFEKATAWARTLQSSPPLPEGPYGTGARWIWRKAHSATYWIYVNTGRIYQGDEVYASDDWNVDLLEEADGL